MWPLLLAPAAVTSDPAPAVAEAAPATPSEPTGVKAWLLGSYATGTWGGARTWLSDHGLTIDLSYTGEAFGNVHGGLSIRPAGSYKGHVDLGLTFDTEKAGLWPGGKLFVLGQNEHGGGFTDRYVGAIQTVSNLDTGAANPAVITQLAELWYEQTLFQGLLLLRFGKQDSNRDFGAPRYGGNFVNNAFGAFPNVPMPSFPTPGLGGVIVVEPSKYVVLRAGAYEGQPQIGSFGFDSAAAPGAGAFTMASVAIRHFFGVDQKHGGVTNVAAWHHSGLFPRIARNPDPRDLAGTTGVTLMHDERIYASPKDKDSTAGLHVFVRMSFAEPSRNNDDRYVGGGIAYHGFPWRENDTVGVGFGSMHIQKPLLGSKDPGTEVFVETFYKLRPTPWFSLEPDFQFFHHPGGDGRDAVILGLRSKLKL
ncbi:Carbohydrate-selective porin [Minicystis rosea]|nr:Carbohydrate-selective porin [Minicystis rosea]